VTEQGEVQNRILLTERNFSPSELVSAAISSISTMSASISKKSAAACRRN
jgi:hypothetical protein